MTSLIICFTPYITASNISDGKKKNTCLRPPLTFLKMILTSYLLFINYSFNTLINYSYFLNTCKNMAKTEQTWAEVTLGFHLKPQITTDHKVLAIRHLITGCDFRIYLLHYSSTEIQNNDDIEHTESFSWWMRMIMCFKSSKRWYWKKILTQILEIQK